MRLRPCRIRAFIRSTNGVTPSSSTKRPPRSRMTTPRTSRSAMSMPINGCRFYHRHHVHRHTPAHQRRSRFSGPRRKRTDGIPTYETRTPTTFLYDRGVHDPHITTGAGAQSHFREPVGERFQSSTRIGTVRAVSRVLTGEQPG